MRIRKGIYSNSVRGVTISPALRRVPRPSTRAGGQQRCYGQTEGRRDRQGLYVRGGMYVSGGSTYMR